MYDRIEKIAVTFKTIYTHSRDKIIGTVMFMHRALIVIDRCHKASIEAIMNIAAIRINGAKIVL